MDADHYTQADRAVTLKPLDVFAESAESGGARLHGEVMVASASNNAGVIVKGIEPKSIGNVIDLKKNIEVGRFEFLEDPERLLHLPASAPRELRYAK